MLDSSCGSSSARSMYKRRWRLTLHKKLLANLAELLHGRFGQVLVVEGTF